VRCEVVGRRRPRLLTCQGERVALARDGWVGRVPRRRIRPAPPRDREVLRTLGEGIAVAAVDDVIAAGLPVACRRNLRRAVALRHLPGAWARPTVGRGCDADGAALARGLDAAGAALARGLDAAGAALAARYEHKDDEDTRDG